MEATIQERVAAAPHPRRAYAARGWAEGILGAGATARRGGAPRTLGTRGLAGRIRTSHRLAQGFVCVLSAGGLWLEGGDVH